MSERIIVTGAAGFIGSNIVRTLNQRGHTNILIVDDLTDLQISNYLDNREFYADFASGRFGQVEAVFHEGACSDTMEHDGRYMMENNYRASKTLLDTFLANGTLLPLQDLAQQGLVEYVYFPYTLVGKYQCHTQADLTRLRAVGCDHGFADVATGTRLGVERLIARGI